MIDSFKILEQHVERVRELRRLEAEATKYALLMNLREYSGKNGYDKIDWTNHNQSKFCINFNYEEGRIEILEITDMRDLGQVYFLTKKACKKAIDLFKPDILRVFQVEGEEIDETDGTDDIETIQQNEVTGRSDGEQVAGS